MSNILRIADSAPLLAVEYITGLLFHPAVSGAALVAFQAASPSAQAILLQRLSFLGHLDPRTVGLALKLVFGYGAVKVVSAIANSAASNSWRLTKAVGWDWPREIAVVTGGSSGIGLHIVEQLAARGVRVAVLDIQPLPENLGSGDHDKRISYFHCDVASPESVNKAADAVRAELGCPSILVNNAGIFVPTSILAMPPATLNKVFQINTMAHWYTAQAFVPHMIARDKGHVVTMSSMAAFISLAKAADYSCTKVSALAFHEALGADLRGIHGAHGVLTSIVHPNFVTTPLIGKYTEMLGDSGIHLLDSDDVARAVTDQIFACKGAQLMLPERLSAISSLRAWPLWLQNPLRNIYANLSKKF